MGPAHTMQSERSPSGCKGVIDAIHRGDLPMIADGTIARMKRVLLARHRGARQKRWHISFAILRIVYARRHPNADAA
jgi:hypothetical protein